MAAGAAQPPGAAAARAQSLHLVPGAVCKGFAAALGAATAPGHHLPDIFFVHFSPPFQVNGNCFHIMFVFANKGYNQFAQIPVLPTKCLFFIIAQTNLH
jgi:hypothetical protein